MFVEVILEAAVGPVPRVRRALRSTRDAYFSNEHRVMYIFYEYGCHLIKLEAEPFPRGSSANVHLSFYSELSAKSHVT